MLLAVPQSQTARHSLNQSPQTPLTPSFTWCLILALLDSTGARQCLGAFPSPCSLPLHPPGFPLLSPRPNPPAVARMENWQERAGEGSFCMWKRRLSYLSQGPLCSHLSYLTPGFPKSWFPGSHSPLCLYSEKAQKRSGRKGICGLEDFQFSHWGVKGRSRPSLWLAAPLTTLPLAP